MISRTREQIELLPKPPWQNALNEVAKLIKDFDADVRRHIEGVPYKEGIIQRIRNPQGKFRRAIRATAPDFQPFNRPTDSETEIRETPSYVQAPVYAGTPSYVQNNHSMNHFSSPHHTDTSLSMPESLQDEEEDSQQGEPASGNEHEALQDSVVIYIDEVQRRMNEQVHLFHLISSEIDR